jgi:hypothetical protein
MSSPDERCISRTRLEDQLAWYDRKSVDCARRFKVLKGAEMIAAAAIPVVAGEHAPAVTAAVLPRSRLDHAGEAHRDPR